MSFKVVILTPNGLYLEKEDVEELYIPSSNGPMGILSGYTPGYFKLGEAGILKVKSKGRTLYFAVFGGFVESKADNKVMVVTGNIEASDSIDSARAIEAQKVAQSRIDENKDANTVRLAKLKLQRNLVRISAKELGQGHE
ncbi:MAG: F0F1 ATP synthase subunit epsilon [Bacilli bacterium]|nr:F0F1 ATP synthase subunit epsilon [Bacilli bacterium]